MSSSATLLASQPELMVRRAQSSEIKAIWELAETVPTAAQWSSAQFETCCAGARPEDVQRRALFVARIPGRPAGERIVGFAVFSVILQIGGGECELENMVVAELRRRQGIARRLLAAGLLWCRAWSPATEPGTGLWLEVRASNRNAIAFYGSAGFVVSGGRPRYYTQPEEDAVLMRKSLDTPL